MQNPEHKCGGGDDSNSDLQPPESLFQLESAHDVVNSTKGRSVTAEVRIYACITMVSVDNKELVHH